MGSRQSSPTSEKDAGSSGASPKIKQRNKTLSQHVGPETEGKGGSLMRFVTGKGKVKGKRFSNTMATPTKAKQSTFSRLSPKRGGGKKIAAEGKSKSEPSMRVSPGGMVRYVSPFESPKAAPKNQIGADRKLDESSKRERLLQVGRLSPVDPRTKKAKIPTLKKATTLSYLNDHYDFTGHVAGGTRSLNMELWYAACTRAGNTKKKVRKGNQDTFLIEDCLGGNPHLTIFGVFDGHGPVGDACSHFVRDCILEHIGAKNNILVDFDENSASKLIAAACRYAAKEVSAFEGIATKFSGCTGIVALVNTKVGKILHFNVGDSRLVLGRGKQKIADIVELSIDHDPDLPGEVERINKAGGRIGVFSGVKRVCLKHEDIPGLAMTRSYGDDLAHSIGVSSEPDVGTRGFGKDERFVVLGSDGVFDFLSLTFISSTVSEMMRLKKTPQEVAERLVCDAVKKWMLGKNEYVDDVTAIVVYLNAHPGKGAIVL